MNDTWKIATYNVNSIRARMPILLEWLERVQPDVVALQETKVQDDKFPVDELKAVGYYSVFKGQKSYNGVAILTKSEPTVISYGLNELEYSNEARLISVKVDNVNIINTYVPQGRDVSSDHFQHKLAWLQRLSEYISHNYQPNEPVIWLGDFNIAPDNRDVHAPEKLFGSVGFHPEEHNLLEIMRNWGLNDIFRQHVTDDGHFTFWDYRVPNGFKRKLGWRIDHIWATKTIAERSLRAWIDTEMRQAEKPSDHAPFIAEFERM
ncbi:exodeoxyribonuclease III [Dendrosporobacter sp. 1207_IL3150]|uniref:exodeoxyribonuclease III n=1 Tax=Dendrosporobacter sp. 1207_IL3150 TaxID=3084054 RepID=UPI002FDA3738